MAVPVVPATAANADTPAAVIDPAVDLNDTQRVTLTASGFSPGGYIVVAQCPSAATTFEACGNYSYPDSETDSNGGVTLEIVLDAILRVGSTETDCRTADTCVLAVAENGGGDVSAAVRVPLAFDPDAPLAPPPELALQPAGAFVDGQRVTLTGTGFVREQAVSVIQCAGTPTDLEDCAGDSGEFFWAEPDGSFAGGFTLYAVIHTPRAGLVDCRVPDACVLVATDGFSETLNGVAVTALAFDPDAPLLPPPSATVAPDRDLVDGQAVTVEGEGFRPDEIISVLQCLPGAVSFDDCAYFNVQYAQTDSEGRFSTALPLFATFTTSGPEPVEIDCRTSASPCVVVAAQRGFTAPRAAHVEVHFDSDAPLLPPPEIDVSPATGIADGGSVTVRGENFTALREVSVRLCEIGTEGEECDNDASDFLQVDTSGNFTASLTLFGEFDIFTGETVDCREAPGCEVVADDYSRGRSARAPVMFGPPPPSRGRYLDRVFDEVDVARDIVYRTTTDYRGNPVDLHLDVWQPKGDTLERRPLMMWMHGGYFIFGDKRNMDYYAREFARRGYVAVSLQYRLRPGVPTSDVGDIVAAGYDAYEDATAAIEWLKSHAAEYRIDPDKVAAGGYSAGAVTGLNLAYLPRQRGPSTSVIDAAVSIAGLTFGAPDPGEPPAIAFHGTNDTTLPISGSETACVRARAVGVHCEVVPYDGSGHEIASTKQRDIVRRTADFLKVWLIDAPPPVAPPPAPPIVSGSVILPAPAGTLAATGGDPRPLAATGLSLLALGWLAVLVAICITPRCSRRRRRLPGP
jgi:acetyl esterase/lipase